jgi:hypothetical protein
MHEWDKRKVNKGEEFNYMLIFYRPPGAAHAQTGEQASLTLKFSAFIFTTGLLKNSYLLLFKLIDKNRKLFILMG